MERIHVTVRARPLSPEDSKTSPWRISANSIFIPSHSTKFEFDHIFSEECKTREVYEARTKEIVTAAVRGFNGTVFAYGQTNSGKTHTMRGSATEPGVIPLAVHDLFDIIQQDVDREFLLRMSYMEIYNEEINDLLVPEHRKLQIHESIERGIYVAGLREEIVASPKQVLDLMEFGESHRHIGETNMNLHSSRSHTIFRMIVESRDRSEDGNGDGDGGGDAISSCDAVRVSVLNLVDLAGSERAAKTGAEGVRLKEGSHINKSLMTLGTVIKKLSEGAESQGGHVPYRDSKLTRILQPALGGNANTAIICNITLAQVHSDETKSSLQFASRALHVTNCARVNEILTDAALLKRQKKEIEELRAKLQGSHSEHLEEEILNLRNILLQSELERERIALELEEEKKAQVERERVLQEQAKKIKNLSSMVLYSSREESRDQFKKDKRRDTWCPGNNAQEALREAYTSVQSNSSAIKPTKSERNMGPLLPFEELVNETGIEDDAYKQGEDCKASILEDCTLPDPCALLHVTNRRKLQPRKKNSFVEDSELLELQTEYEDLLLKFETERTMSEIKIDCLKRKLAEADSFFDMRHSESYDHSVFHANKNYADKNISLREFEAILVIKQLQEKIKILETEKSSSQENLSSLVELATEQNICAREKFDELSEELFNAREEVRAAHQKLAQNESVGRKNGDYDLVTKLSKEVKDLIYEAQEMKEVVQNLSSLADEAFQSFSAITEEFIDFKDIICQTSVQERIIITNTEKLHGQMLQRNLELENEKLLLHNQSIYLQKQVEELREDAQHHQATLMALSEEHDMEKSEYFSHIQNLEKKISNLSTCFLAKEKEGLRKDLEKTKMKLKDTESKLKNTIQEKTKLEGEKAFAEREIKQLRGQKSLLERDISRRDSLAGRRRDSVFDPKKSKAMEHTMQEDYKKLEVLAFEMETTIASLEEKLEAANSEKEEAIARNEDLTLELVALTEKMNVSSLEMDSLHEKLAGLSLTLEKANSNQQEMERSIKRLLAEKEELAMQLTNSLLETEEERAILCAKEKASVEAIEEKAKVYSIEITALSQTLSEVMKELESYRKECNVLREKLECLDENAKLEKKCSIQKSLEIDQLQNDIRDAESKQAQQLLKLNFEKLSLELQHAQEELSVAKRERDELSAKIGQLDIRSELSDELQKLENQLFNMSRERDKLMTQIEKQQSCLVEAEMSRKDSNNVLMEAKVQVEELSSRLSCMEVKMHNDQVNNGKEMARYRMRLHGTQAQLDAIRYRYKQALDESNMMNQKFEEASANLKQRLASKGIEVLNLKKQLAAVQPQSSD